ncbi:unnamed protein product [Diplocarpon coronariae]
MRFSLLNPAFMASLSLFAAMSQAWGAKYPNVNHQSKVKDLMAKANYDHAESWLETFTNFHNRHYLSEFGALAGIWLFEEIKKVTSPSPSIETIKIEHNFNQSSIIVRIPGEKDSTVIVSTYYDTFAGYRSARAPGATDNASTVVAFLEALRVISMKKKLNLRNTLEFHFYAGSHGGFYGAQQIISAYHKEKKNIVALLHQANVGYSPTGKINLYTDHSDVDLRRYVGHVAVHYSDGIGPLGACGYLCGDHVIARSRGFPTAYVTGDWETPWYVGGKDDSMEKVDPSAVLRHAKFTIAFAIETSLNKIGK